MPIYDNDGSANREIGKLYDNNGSANTQIGKVYDNDGSTNRLIYNAELIVVPNTTDFPYSKYNLSLLDNGGGLTVNDTKAEVNTWNTWNGGVHLAILPINCSGFSTLSYSLYTNGHGDGNFRTTLGFSTTIPSRQALVEPNLSKFNVLGIADSWYTNSKTWTGSLNITGRGTIYLIFGQGTTIAAGDYGHGQVGVTSVKLT